MYKQRCTREAPRTLLKKGDIAERIKKTRGQLLHEQHTNLNSNVAIGKIGIWGLLGGIESEPRQNACLGRGYQVPGERQGTRTKVICPIRAKRWHAKIIPLIVCIHKEGLRDGTLKQYY